MNSYREFNKNFFMITILGFITLILINYIVDPFDIFHTKILKKQFQQNERFSKAEFLASNAKHYNSYMLGSSRIGTTEPLFVEKYIPETKFYNYYVSEGTMYDNLENLKFIISTGGTIKNIYLQIDITEMLTVYKYSPDNYLFRYAPHVLNTNIFSYKLNYLTIAPYINIIGKIRNNIKENFNYKRVDLYNSGCWYQDAKEEALIKDSVSYTANESSFHISAYRSVQDRHLQENLDALKLIVNICKENNIKIIMFIAPHNHKMLDSINSNDYMRILQSVGEINDYWDFSGYNTITNDNSNYYERSHYRPRVAKMIAAKIFNDTEVVLPNDFGIFVTRQNLNSHIAKRKLEVLTHDAK